MGHIFKPVLMRPLPPGAEIVERNGERVARWRNARGKLVTAAVRETDKGLRSVVDGKFWVARFKDGLGVTRTVSTKCSDHSAAKAVLGDLVRRGELVRSGILSEAEDAVADHKRADIAVHLDAFMQMMRAKGDDERHVKNVQRLITTVFTACRFKTLKDVRREPIEHWLMSPENRTRATRTRNAYVEACKWFMRWVVESERLLTNPIARIELPDPATDRRRQPRAFTGDELVRILDAARRRPLEEALKFNRGWHKGKNGARLRPETRAKIERLGEERALAYKTMALTGLRLGEMRAIRVCDVLIDGPAPHIVLESRHEKNRKGSTIPLRGDLVADLRGWIASGSGMSDRLLFRLTPGQVRVFDRDLKFAGIAKHDDRGRVACIHSLRHSFATLLNRAGVPPRVAMAALRHSDLSLTMAIYTDPRLLDVAAAMDTLPALPMPTSATGA